MSHEFEELLVKIEMLKNMLVARATGESADEGDYQILRQELLAHPLLKDKLPRFVRTCRTFGEFWPFIKDKFGTYAERRGFLGEQFNPVLTFLEDQVAAPADSAADEVLGQVDTPHVQAVWRKALERRANDPEGAITSARTLLETTCKHILDEAGVEYNDSADLPSLYSLTAKTLNLSPSQHSEDIFKQILGGCHSVVQGLGALRNSLSDAHGKGKKAPKPASRHAALAVNLAGAMASFLIETWEARQQF